jgi:hypothetical protein
VRDTRAGCQAVVEEGFGSVQVRVSPVVVENLQLRVARVLNLGRPAYVGFGRWCAGGNDVPVVARAAVICSRAVIKAQPSRLTALSTCSSFETFGSFSFQAGFAAFGLAADSGLIVAEGDVIAGVAGAGAAGGCWGLELLGPAGLLAINSDRLFYMSFLISTGS